MKIDLMALAKQADETYLDVDCTFGKVRVYHVPDAALEHKSVRLKKGRMAMTNGGTR
jgi:hypothetical protein